MTYLHIFGVLLLSSLSLGRGPHHPRGETVAKQHVHYRPIKGEDHEKLTQDSQLLHDKEHIREDLGDWMEEKAIEEMSDEELEFHFFNLHDSDKNSHLDGLEILKAIRHISEHEEDDGHEDEESNDIDFYVELIDEVLLQDDANADGFISYPEYVAANKKEVQTKAIRDILIGPAYS